MSNTRRHITTLTRIFAALQEAGKPELSTNLADLLEEIALTESQTNGAPPDIRVLREANGSLTQENYLLAETAKANSQKAQEFQEQNEKLADDNQALRSALENVKRVAMQTGESLAAIADELSDEKAKNHRQVVLIHALQDDAYKLRADRDEWKSLAESYDRGEPPTTGKGAPTAKRPYTRNTTGVTPGQIRQAIADGRGRSLTQMEHDLLDARWGLTTGAPLDYEGLAQRFQVGHGTLNKQIAVALSKLGFEPRRYPGISRAVQQQHERRRNEQQQQQTTPTTDEAK